MNTLHNLGFLKIRNISLVAKLVLHNIYFTRELNKVQHFYNNRQDFIPHFSSIFNIREILNILIRNKQFGIDDGTEIENFEIFTTNITF